MPVEIWFPSAIYFEDLKVPEEARAAALEAARERAAPAFESGAPGVTASGTRNDLHLDPRVQPLLEHFRVPLRHFLFELMQLDPGKVEFHLGRCWPVVQREGSGGLHIHHATFSGVFFLEAPAGSGALEFYNPVEWPHDGLERVTDNELNYKSTTYPAVEGRLILFSSRLRHRRLQSEEGAGDRIGIAFDLYAMSTLESGSAGVPRAEFLQRFP